MRQHFSCHATCNIFHVLTLRLFFSLKSNIDRGVYCFRRPENDKWGKRKRVGVLGYYNIAVEMND
jgi:hypothetical protein